MQVDAHVYHRLGLLSQSGLATFSEVPAYFRLDGRPTCLWHHCAATTAGIGSGTGTRSIVALQVNDATERWSRGRPAAAAASVLIERRHPEEPGWKTNPILGEVWVNERG
jgi:hypothetical protein